LAVKIIWEPEKKNNKIKGVFMLKSERAEKARQTLEYFNKGWYMLGNNKINCQSCFTTEFISEQQLDALILPDNNFMPQYEVVNESVVNTIFKLGNCGVLNFASAKNPGGGFLNGAVAQEECLAVSSDLYNSQLKAFQYYDINKNNKTMLYTHNMIYSRDITFIRDGSLNTVKSPVTANVVTSPAVNAGAYYKNENGNKFTVLEVMEKRMRYILKLFAAKNDVKIILGAYGCGVFGNDTFDVASIFHKLLKNEGIEKYFEHIVFAGYDPRNQQYNIFKNKFSAQE
jgi:uncharacterized protein (TIGR02452 family)